MSLNYTKTAASIADAPKAHAWICRPCPPGQINNSRNDPKFPIFEVLLVKESVGLKKTKEWFQNRADLGARASSIDVICFLK
jgi:hypothetical protein